MERIYDDILHEEVYVNSYTNGLKAFVIKKKNFSKAFAGYATKYGSVDSKFIHPKTNEIVEVPDGIAHFLEHKLFEEQEGNVFDRFAKFGAMANAFTSFKETVYYFISTQNFYENFEILLDFVQNPYFTDQNVEKEKGIIAQEIRMYQDNPNWRVYFNLLNALYVEHPVKIDIAGTLDSIQKITKDDLYLCYNTFYHPSNMIVVVCGDVDPQKVFDMVEKMEKTKEYQSLIERIYPEEPDRVNQKRIEVKLSISTPIFYIGFKDHLNDLPPYDMIMKDIETQILAEMLFGKSTDFYEQLYKEGLINQSFGFEYNCEPDYSFFMIGGESKDPDQVYKRVLEHIENVKKNGIDKNEFERAKKVVLGNHLRKFDNLEKLSVEFIYSYFKGINIFEYVKEINSVSYERCQNRLKSFLRKTKAVFLLFGRYNKKLLDVRKQMYDNSIVFPGFHLKFNFSPIAFKIFGLEVRWYGIIIAFGFLCGFLVSSYIAKKENVQTEVLLDIAIIALPVAIIFARVYYVLFNFKEFKDNLLSIFAIRQGGLAIYGAVIGALVSTYIYCRTKKISFLKICDIGVHGLILGQAIGRWGNFANREAYGYETNLPWRMQIYSVEAGKRIEVHPTFLYESVWDFLVFFALLILRRYKKKDGEIFGFYLILYSAGRFFIEALRTDSLMLGPIRVSQLVAVICIIIGSTIVLKLRLQYFDKI